MAEAVEAVAMGADCGVLDVIEVLADFLGCVDAVIEVGDEAGDGSLEVDVVFPESVVGVNKQGLGSPEAGLEFGWLGIEDHGLII